MSQSRLRNWIRKYRGRSHFQSRIGSGSFGAKVVRYFWEVDPGLLTRLIDPNIQVKYHNVIHRFQPTGSTRLVFGSSLGHSGSSFSSSPASPAAPSSSYLSSSSRFPSSVSSYVSSSSRPFRPTSTVLSTSSTYYPATNFQLGSTR
jgi:hypothetical protein